MSATENESFYYDLSAIKQIPIISAAELLDCQIEKVGENFWCSVQGREDPLVFLDPEQNLFYDFDSHIHGDVIRFVQHAKMFSPKEAVEFLADSFDLEPTLTKSEILSRPLTNWEYHKIGLHGDMTTKNFVFPISHAESHSLEGLGEDAALPLSSLKARDPELFRFLLERRALPFIQSLRNDYSHHVWNYFQTASRPDGSKIHLRQDELREHFAADTDRLNRCERILYRACRSAGLDLPDPFVHDPVIHVRQMVQGEQALSLGNTSLKELSALSERTGCSILEANMSYDEYLDQRLQSLGHCAVFYGGNVFVQYLSSDEAEVKNILESFNRETEQSNPENLRPSPAPSSEITPPAKEK